MRIAHLTPTFFAFHGADRVVHRLALEQKDEGNSVTIFTLEADMEPPEKVGLEIMKMPRNLTWQSIYQLVMPLDIHKVLRWLPKLKGFDVIYSYCYPMNWLAYLAKRFYGVKFTYYNYGISYPEIYPSFLERTYLRIFIALANWTNRRADGAISISQFLRQQLEKETGLVSQVVYPEIEINRFHERLDGSSVRDKYNLGSRPLIVYVGRISPQKGVHLLVEAFRLVEQAVSDVKLLIVGKPTFPGYFKKLREMADISVIFAGYVADEELPYYYAACDVYATATMWEGFNLPLAEAQACGKPVVAFDIGPHPEVVKDGETGFLVPAQDIHALAEAMIKLLGNVKLRQRLGENACRIVREKFA
jgi:glycosyltransferase involved in cell wall biosynthesis